MIHVFEGPEGSGKTTLARIASDLFSVPRFYDAGRHGSMTSRNAREWMMTGSQHNLDVAEFSRMSDFVVDRWVLTSYVYDGLRGSRDSVDVYERIASRAVATVFVLVAPIEVLLERTRDRNDGRKIEATDLEARVDGFHEAVRYFSGLGMKIVSVNANRTTKEVFDEVRSNWG